MVSAHSVVTAIVTVIATALIVSLSACSSSDDLACREYST